MRRLVAVVLVVSLTSVSMAAASPRHHRARRARAVPAERYNPAQAAYTVAARYWGKVPCGGDVRMVVAVPPVNDELVAAGSVSSMWATWDRGTSWENREDAPQPFSGCIIGINPLLWSTERLAGFTLWPEFSIAMVHEFGHLLGLGHSTDPASVMYPDTSANLSITGTTAPGWID